MFWEEHVYYPPMAKCDYQQAEITWFVKGYLRNGPWCLLLFIFPSKMYHRSHGVYWVFYFLKALKLSPWFFEKGLSHVTTVTKWKQLPKQRAKGESSLKFINFPSQTNKSNFPPISCGFSWFQTREGLDTFAIDINIGSVHWLCLNPKSPNKLGHFVWGSKWSRRGRFNSKAKVKTVQD